MKSMFYIIQWGVLKMEKDKYLGVCKVGKKGQIVIPVEARKIFNINPLV